jgi:hypothetical protein
MAGQRSTKHGKFTTAKSPYTDLDKQGRQARRLLLAGTHKIEINRDKGTARLVKIDKPVDTTGGHDLDELNAVCREIYGDNWDTVPYWYVAEVREKAVRVLDWLAIREYL